MATYARINSLTKKVDNIIEADDSFIQHRSDYDLWIKTSEVLTKKLASRGDNYIIDINAFKSESPYSSWIFNESTWSWEAPTPVPDIIDNEVWGWDEATTSWKEIT